MLKMCYCRYNLDTASVETIFSDGSMLSLDTSAVEDYLNVTASQQSDLDWLIYNKPSEYVQLVLSGQIADYIRAPALHGLED